MGVLLYVCCMFGEYIFWRTPVGDWFWISNVTRLVKMILKNYKYFAHLNYPLLLKLFFYNWCNYLIFMYKIWKCWEWIAVYNYEKRKIIQIYSKIFLTLEIAWGGFFFFENTRYKKGVLRNFAKFTGNTCARVSFWIKLQAPGCSFIKKETLAQVFFSELCEISKNTFFIEHLRTIASVTLMSDQDITYLWWMLHRI